jgi:excisionase family DNA binding protein
MLQEISRAYIFGRQHNATKGGGRMTVEKWVDCSTAADYLSKEPDWVRENLVALGIPHHRLGRQYRFKLSQIDIWMIENQQTTNMKAVEYGK